jgi:hypothetical protein
MGKTRYAYSPALGRHVKVETKQPPPRKRKRKPFKVSWFKFPAWWIEVLHKAGAGARLLAPIILAEAFKRAYIKGDIVLSSEVTKMPPTTRRRAIRDLVRLGLIAVEQNGNGAPIVVAIHHNKPGAEIGGQGAENGG